MQSRPPNDSSTTSPTEEPLADATRFREPTRREHWIGAGLFVMFGIFFAALFVVEAGWWFRWPVLALGAWSVVHGLGHAVDARRARLSG